MLDQKTGLFLKAINERVSQDMLENFFCKEFFLKNDENEHDLKTIEDFISTEIV